MVLKRIAAVEQLYHRLARVRLTLQRCNDSSQLVVWALAEHSGAICAVDGLTIIGRLLVLRDVVLDEVQRVVAGEYPEQFTQAAEKDTARFSTTKAKTGGRKLQQDAVDFARRPLRGLDAGAARKKLPINFGQEVIQGIGTYIHGV